MRATAAIAVVVFGLVFTRPARADEPNPNALRARREGLVAFGVPPEDSAMRLADRALERCVRTPTSAFCSLADAAFDLAAARVEEGDAESVARAFELEPVRCAGEAGLAEARSIVPGIAPRLADADRRLRAADERSRPALTMLVRIVRELAVTRASTARTLERVAAHATPAPESAALERARTLVDETIVEASAADDEYVGRHRRGTARSRERDRVAATATLLRSLPARIAALPESERAALTARFEAARAIVDSDAKLDALVDLAGEIDARTRR